LGGASLPQQATDFLVQTRSFAVPRGRLFLELGVLVLQFTLARRQQARLALELLAPGLDPGLNFLASVDEFSVLFGQLPGQGLHFVRASRCSSASFRRVWASDWASAAGAIEPHSRAHSSSVASRISRASS
jgi:hypothetical protein